MSMRHPRRRGKRGRRVGRVLALGVWAAACSVSPRASDTALPPGLATPPRVIPVSASFRVVAYNIKHGRGMDDVVDLPRVAGVLRQLNADVIALQEVDDRTERTGGVDQVGVLAELLGYRGFHGPHRPYQGGHYGNAVLTRLPVRCVVTHSIPPTSGSALSVLEVEVAAAAGPVSVVSVHLAGSPEERMAQAETVTGFFHARAGHDVPAHPVILAGDFNGRPDDPVVRALAREWTILRKAGDPGTYPADRPDREIDFVMLRPHDPVQLLDPVVVEEAAASDHRPLLAVLRFGVRLPRPTPRPCPTP